MCDVLTTMEEARALGDTDRLGHYMDLFDAVCRGVPASERGEAIRRACRDDISEEQAELEYREQPCKQTARRWFDAMGREARSNEPAMAALREQWGL